MKKRIVLFVLLLAPAKGISDTLISIFELPFSSPYPPYTDNRNNMGLPIEFQSVKLPITERDGLPMFYDYRLLYMIDTGAIYSVQANRVYEKYEVCESDRKVVEKTIKKRIEGVQKIDSSTYENTKLKVDMGCFLKGDESFFTLSLLIFDKQTLKRIDHKSR